MQIRICTPYANFEMQINYVHTVPQVGTTKARMHCTVLCDQMQDTTSRATKPGAYTAQLGGLLSYCTSLARRCATKSRTLTRPSGRPTTITFVRAGTAAPARAGAAGLTVRYGLAEPAGATRAHIRARLGERRLHG